MTPVSNSHICFLMTFILVFAAHQCSGSFQIVETGLPIKSSSAADVNQTVNVLITRFRDRLRLLSGALAGGMFDSRSNKDQEDRKHEFDSTLDQVDEVTKIIATDKNETLNPIKETGTERFRRFVKFRRRPNSRGNQRYDIILYIAEVRVPAKG